MTATATTATKATRRRPWAAAVLAAAVAAVLAGGCTSRQIEDFLHASGKIAYDSMKARQESR